MHYIAHILFKTRSGHNIVPAFSGSGGGTQTYPSGQFMGKCSYLISSVFITMWTFCRIQTGVKTLIPPNACWNQFISVVSGITIMSSWLVLAEPWIGLKTRNQFMFWPLTLENKCSAPPKGPLPSSYNESGTLLKILLTLHHIIVSQTHQWGAGGLLQRYWCPVILALCQNQHHSVIYYTFFCMRLLIYTKIYLLK